MHRVASPSTRSEWRRLRRDADAGRDRDNFCYRHPDRQSFVLCQRCGRTICPQCQTQAAGRRALPGVRARGAGVGAAREAGDRDARCAAQGAPVVTYTLIARERARVRGRSSSSRRLGYAQLSPTSRRFTLRRAVAHGHVDVHALGGVPVPAHPLQHVHAVHLRARARAACSGSARFLALYLLSGLGGSVAVMLLSRRRLRCVGASGAIFGLLGAFFVIQRRLGRLERRQLLVLIGMNLVIGFILPGISWQAHVGGLIVGAAVAFIYMRTRAARAAAGCRCCSRRHSASRWS